MREDAHWADEMSLRLMAFLARRIRSSPILVVMTIRDEEVASAPVLRQVVDELARESHFVPLALTPLSRASTIALVRSLVSASTAGVDARLDAEIWRVSTGNPFLVVETIRAIQEGVAPRTPATLPLPERVRRVVAGRLERLSDRGRHLASVAAVVGREFDFALLQRAGGSTNGTPPRASRSWCAVACCTASASSSISPTSGFARSCTASSSIRGGSAFTS